MSAIDRKAASRTETAALETSRSPRRYAAALVPALVALLLYLPSLSGSLVWDDELHVPLAREMTIAQAFGSAGGEYRRPLVLLSYAAQWHAGLASAGALHAGNVLLHAGNTLLLSRLLMTTGLPAAVAAAAALIFALHPVQSGSVAYVSGRTDLLAAMFTLLALTLAVRSPHRASTDKPSRGSALAALGCASCVVLAALSKEIGLAAGPLVALLYHYQRRSGRQPSALLPAGALLGSVCSALLVLPPAALSGQLPLALRLRAAGTTAATYAQLLLWPSALHLDRLTPTAAAPAIAVALALAAAGCAVFVRFFRTPTLAGLAAAAALLLYFPGSNFIPVSPAIAGHLVFTPEQFLYLPLAPLSALLAAVLHRYAGYRGAPAAAAIVCVLSVPPVLARQHEFKSAEQVYRTTLAHSPSPRACFNLGRLQLDARRYDESVSTYQRCVELSPHDAGTRGQLAIALQKVGRGAEARASYERATGLDSRSPLLWSNFATLDANEGRYDDARTKWQRALALDPSFAPARAALSKLDQAGRP